MIYSGKTTSVKTVIAKVYRDLDLREEDSFINFLEWSAEALEKIGAFTQLETKLVSLALDNYKAELPHDIVYINQVTLDGYPILPSTSTFGASQIDIPNPTAKPYAFYQDKIENTVFVNPADSGLYMLNSRRGIYERVKYTISGGHIRTSFCNGDLKMSYQALPLDCDGFPLIPDYVEFREAVYWYINMKYTYAQWRRGEVRDGVYSHAQDQWHWYCQQAANKAMIPDLGALENIKRSYLSLKPKMEEFRTLFNNLNSNRANYY